LENPSKNLDAALGVGGAVLFFTAFTTMNTLSVLAIFAFVSVTLTPVLTGYRGRFSSKLSGFGFTAEVSINGREEADQPK
jgi:hypothetical protein